MWNGNEHWIEFNQGTAANGYGTYTWNTTGMNSGTYYLAGYLYANGAPTYSHLTKSITIAAALTLAEPQDEHDKLPLSADSILNSQNDLTSIVFEAAQRLYEETGRQVLANVSVKIADLPGNLLGETVGNAILIDRDAAGYGWFVDLTPGDDREFSNPIGPHDLAASNGSPAAHRVDLLTAVMHEMGHVLGYDHSDSLDLMAPTLPLGARRTLAGQSALATAGQGSDFSCNYPSAYPNVLDQLFASLD